MDVIAWAIINRSVTLNRGGRGLISIARGPATVHDTEQNSHAPVHQKLQDRIIRIENHSANHRVSNVLVEWSVEIAI